MIFINAHSYKETAHEKLQYIDHTKFDEELFNNAHARTHAHIYYAFKNT